jgi:CheY-like chemotaxis protein
MGEPTDPTTSAVDSPLLFGEVGADVKHAGEGRLSNLLEALSEAAMVVYAGQVIAHNTALDALLREGADVPLVPRTAGEFFGRYLATTSEVALELLARCQEAPRPGELERVELRRPHGRRMNVALSFAPLRLAEGPGLLLRLKEQSEPHLRPADVRKRELLALTGQLASGVAHAINNPLAYVTTNIAYCRERLEYIQTLLSGENDVQLDSPRMIRGLLLPLSEALGEAELGTTRVEHLARNLKTLAEADHGTSRARVSEAVESALLLCEAACRQKARVRTDTTTNASTTGSPARLTQALANLIFSLAAAFEDNRPSKNRITIRTFARGEEIFVDFLTNGPGFSSSTLRAVETIGLEAWTPEDGPALWLLSAKRLLQPLGGRLALSAQELRGEPTAGIIARVKVPAAPALDRQHPRKREPRNFERKPRILVVDNEELIVRAISRFLGHDYDIDTAGDGREALQIISASPAADLILCDLLMPEMSGIELYRTVSREFPTLASHFAFLTGGAPTEETQEFLRTVDRPTLSKPLDPSSLRAAVRDLLLA